MGHRGGRRRLGWRDRLGPVRGHVNVRLHLKDAEQLLKGFKIENGVVRVPF